MSEKILLVLEMEKQGAGLCLINVAMCDDIYTTKLVISKLFFFFFSSLTLKCLIRNLDNCGYNMPNLCWPDSLSSVIHKLRTRQPSCDLVDIIHYLIAPSNEQLKYLWQPPHIPKLDIVGSEFRWSLRCTKFVEIKGMQNITMKITKI